jgi:hypothetical protein
MEVNTLGLVRHVKVKLDNSKGDRLNSDKLGKSKD